MTKPENKEKIIKLGNKPDAVYIKLIFDKLIKHTYIYVKVMDFPDYLNKFNGIYIVAINYGIVCIGDFLKIQEPNRNNDGVIDVCVFKLENIPRILKWREEFKKSELHMLGIKV